MSGGAKEGAGLGVQAGAAAAAAAAAAGAGAAAAAERLLKSDDELLMKHYPRYFYDKREKLFPLDLNTYTADKSAVDGCNGVATTSKDGKHTWLMYMNYYLRDGGVACLGGKGGHKHDLEIVIVEVDKSTQQITGVFYGPHSSHEHMWIRNKEDIKQITGNTGRPRVYASLGKHGSYPISGLVIRLFGVGTDKCIDPTANDRPLFLLDQSTQDVERIDGEFSGPKTKIGRDWSVAPPTRLDDVRWRRAVPPSKQVRKELAKLKFWGKK